MEFTLLRGPEELILTIAKDNVFEEYGISIQNEEFSVKLLGINIHGKLIKRIEDNAITFIFLSKIAGAKMTLSIFKYDEYSSRLKINIDSWGILGGLLKRKLNEIMLNFIIDVEFETKKYISFEKKLFVKMQTNYKGLKELINKLSDYSSHYYFLIINKRYVVEIVNGIPLAGEELKEYCKDMCSVELYELKPLGNN